jgi:hypothetical protein
MDSDMDEINAKYRSIFSDQEWSLLVGLPESVLSAASIVESDSGHRTQSEGEAGLAAIADGRGSGSPLVEAVATALVAQLGGDPDLGEEPPVVVAPDDPAGYIAECLARAQAASALLAAKSPEDIGAGDAGAYRHWLVTIADSVVNAASSGGLLGIGGERVSAAEQSFVGRLTVALGD